MGLLDLIGGIVKPVTQPVTDILDFANLNKYAAGDQDLKNFNPSFSSKEDFDKSLGQYGNDALGTGVQRAAGFGSAFVPGGAGVGGMAASGALAGGLAGLSSADNLKDPNLLQNIALGAGTGGALGGTLGGVSEFLGSKLPNYGDDIANSLDNTIGDTIKLDQTPIKPTIQQSLKPQVEKPGSFTDEVTKQLESLIGVDNTGETELAKRLQSTIAHEGKVPTTVNELRGAAPDLKRSTLFPKKTVTQLREGVNSAPLAQQEEGLLQNIGRDLKDKGNKIQLKDLGVKATKKTGLNYTGAVDNEINSLASSLEKEGLPMSHEGISSLAEKVGKTRENLLYANRKSSTPVIVDANDLINNQADVLRRRAGINNSVDARSLLQDELNKIAAEKGVKGRDLLNNNFKLDALDLQDLFSKTRDASEKVGAGKSVGNDLKAQALLHEFAGDQLKSIPGYAEHNDTFFSLYDQLNNLRSNYNNQGDFTLSKRGLVEKGLGKVKNLGGKAMSSIGNTLESGGSNLAIPGGLQNIAGQASSALANPTAQNVLSRIGANAVTGGTNSQPGTQATQLDQLPTNTTSPGQDRFGRTQSDINPSKGLENMSRQELAQAALSFGLKPNDIKFLLDTFKPEADPKQLAAQQDQQNAVQSLSDLSSQVDQNGSRFGALQGGGLGDFFANTLGLDPERSALQTQIGLVNQTIGKALEGKSLTDKDRAFYKTLLPTLQDNPEAAKSKINKLKQIIGTTGI